MIAEGETKRGIWLLRIVSTRWRESSFDRIPCDLTSRSLAGGKVVKESIEESETHLSWFKGFIVSLHSARNTKKASLINRSLVDISL